VMGIVNVTPDSFTDGGRFLQADVAVAHALRLAAEGADIIDIGGESTRPGFTPIAAEEEIRRVVPVLEGLTGLLSCRISIDTTKAVVAREALARGATMVNDIWGLQGDPAMAGTVAEASATVVVMHNRATKDDSIDIIDDMQRFFETSLAVADWAGLDRSRVILDPGVGFGKTPRQQVEAIAALPRLLAFGLPILVGLSRKSFLAALSGAAVPDRLRDTIAANLAAFAGGATLFRVHDVAEHVAALTVFSKLHPRAAS
jgi:dihydropteroate synthase